MATERSDALVLFGVTGDLAKKLVLPALYRLDERGEFDLPVIGVARSDWGIEDLATHAREAVHDALGDDVDAQVLERFVKRLDYVQGEYAETKTFDELKSRIGDRAATALYYLAVPPSLFADVAAALAREGLNTGSRLVVEKPFGHDLVSAKALDAELKKYFAEQRIFRVDHFLGKESVEDITVFRFANRLFEPVWSAEHVSAVQITFAETLDVADRGSFYDSVGAVRDVLENHLFQVLAYVAMDAPAGSAGTAEQDERTRLLRSVRTLELDDVVFGQYRGYRDVDGVEADSTTETYAALKLYIDNPRWEGVPFTIRTGKVLPVDALEVVVALRPASPAPVLGASDTPEPNLVRLRLQPDAGITLDVLAKAPGRGYELRPARLSVDFEPVLGKAPLAYERILADALDGLSVHFATQQGVEEAWRIVDPVLDSAAPPIEYEPKTWGPPAADALVAPGGWLPISASTTS